MVLIGEMRDLETVESALRIAETGHLTFGTLHTNSASSTINRIIDVFPSHQQSQIRTQLSLVIEGIVCQSLLPRADGKGRVVSLEILVPTPGIRNLIREDKVHQIYSAMQTGQEKLGMQTMNQSLATLYFRRLITLETAMNASSNREELQEMINRGAGVVAGAGMGRPGGPGAGPRPPVRPGLVSAMVESPGASPQSTIGTLISEIDYGNFCILRTHPDRRIGVGRTHRRHHGRGGGGAAPRADPGHPHPAGQGQGGGQGGQDAQGAQRAGQEPGGLHAPVLGDDRRRPAAGAVSRHSRQPGRAPVLRAGDPGDPHRRRGRHVARRRHEAAPEGVRRRCSAT